MRFTSIRSFCHTAKAAFVSSFCLLPPSGVMGYRYIDPKKFATEQAPQILKTLGANDSLLKVHQGVSSQMTSILESSMVQRMAKGTLAKEEWEEKYMKADVLYIYKLGQELAKRAKNEQEKDQIHVREMAEMFLGYGKHFDRLKKYGLSPTDTLICQECDEHIALLSQRTSIQEFYISILTDMIPYVVFANYLLQSIDPSDHNPWIEYAKKYGDLNNKYARDKMSKIISIVNPILANHEIENQTAEKLFAEGFSFEEWFIRNAFSKGFNIKATD